MRDERIDALESKVDEYEQRDRDRNIIITGLPNGEANNKGVQKFLNENIGTNLNVFDVEYTSKSQGGVHREKEQNPCDEEQEKVQR